MVALIKSQEGTRGTLHRRLEREIDEIRLVAALYAKNS